MFTESTMDDDIAHFAIAPQILNLLFVRTPGIVKGNKSLSIKSFGLV